MTNEIKSLVLLFCFLLGCHAPSTRPNQNKTDQSIVKDTLHVDPNYNYINLIPDSLRTPEQKQFLRRFLILAAKHIEIRNNHMVFTLSRDQLVEQGIPAPYYDMLQKNLRDNNAAFEKNNVKNVDSLWQNVLLTLKDSIE
ncbi:hypothetical protein [Arachidicoccus terrestris]|uniref:hypothetical protein n=1 Tax=Arachidicoccus terrestris TaxID=2875539 RepID=UPI001CC736AD|nr:hypothetical protein [Arachidicoccus terrestris]UAY55442.1 hypothetical protein K9M52_18900 [Arachidicoccus terrestris]